jgi:hypothetical protein
MVTVRAAGAGSLQPIAKTTTQKTRREILRAQKGHIYASQNDTAGVE